MEKIAERIVLWQIQKNVIKEEDKAVYVYAYETLLMRVINFLIAIIAGVVTKSLLAVVIFLVSYIPLRTYAGGYHSRNSIRCMIFSTLLIIGVALITKVSLYERSLFGFFVFVGIGILSYIVILFASPVEDENKPLSEEERAGCAMKARVIGTIIIIVSFVCVLAGNPELGSTLLLVLVIMACMLLLGIANNRRLKKKVF